MERFAGHVFSIQKFETRFVLNEALKELREIPDNRFDLLANPFEKKLTLRNTAALPQYLGMVVWSLETHWRGWTSEQLNVPLYEDEARHYCSIFKYLPGGFLACHVDAGIHPLMEMRKHATAIVYLGEVDTGGELELWAGTSAAHDPAESIKREPTVTGPAIYIRPEHGNVIIFEGNDQSWHAVSECRGEAPRYAITVSYLSEIGEREQWHQGQRAFFAPRPYEKWDQRMYELRDLRSDPERYAEVYRTE